MIKREKGMNVLVIGAGMYVSGKGTSGYGTILPALCEWQRRGFAIGSVFLAATSSQSIKLAKDKFKSLNVLMGTDIQLKTFPEKNEEEVNTKSYLQALSEIPKPACAIVVVPDELHSEIASSCIEAGLHTLVVKPLAPTLEEVNELIKLQNMKRVYCAVEFHKRFDRANLKLRDFLEHGKLGDPLYFIVEYSQRKEIPVERFCNWVESVNIFQYLGIHYVDIIYFSTGAMPRRVMGLGQKNWLLSKGIDTYDSVQGFIEWETPSGKLFSSAIFTNWIDPANTSAMSDQRIKVIGTKGRYESDQKSRGVILITDEDGIEEINPDFCNTYYSSGIGNGMAFMGYGIDSIHQFLNDSIKVENEDITIEELEGKRPTFKASMIPTMVIEGINKSLEKNGSWVEL